MLDWLLCLIGVSFLALASFTLNWMLADVRHKALERILLERQVRAFEQQAEIQRAIFLEDLTDRQRTRTEQQTNVPNSATSAQREERAFRNQYGTASSASSPGAPKDGK